MQKNAVSRPAGRDSTWGTGRSRMTSSPFPSAGSRSRRRALTGPTIRDSNRSLFSPGSERYHPQRGAEVIVFGTAVTDPETYDGCAVPGIQRAAEPDSLIFAHQTAGSLFRNYNLLLDMAAEHEGLEALVLVHQDAELDDLDFATKVREALRDPDVAIIGCVGAVGVRGIAWWQGAVTWASV